jgi:hypothetical protein
MNVDVSHPREDEAGLVELMVGVPQVRADLDNLVAVDMNLPLGNSLGTRQPASDNHAPFPSENVMKVNATRDPRDAACGRRTCCIRIVAALRLSLQDDRKTETQRSRLPAFFRRAERLP